jgi:chemotaxis signal transduction protein
LCDKRSYAELTLVRAAGEAGDDGLLTQGFETIERELRSRLVVINTGKRVVGLVVDTAREFLKIPTDSIAPPPEALTGLSGHYLEGIATIGGRMILILNLEAVLDLDYKIEPQIS